MTLRPQPSQVGIALDSLGFDTYVNGIMIASVSGAHVALAPQSASDLALAGRLVPQGSAPGLAAVSGVFDNFVHGKDSSVKVRGASAGSPDVRPLSWLTLSPHQIIRRSLG